MAVAETTHPSLETVQLETLLVSAQKRPVYWSSAPASFKEATFFPALNQIPGVLYEGNLAKIFW
jgi:hypothetical protein